MNIQQTFNHIFDKFKELMTPDYMFELYNMVNGYTPIKSTKLPETIKDYYKKMKK